MKESLLSTCSAKKEYKMRIYVPNKDEAIINEILKDLYLLRQEIDFGIGVPASKLKLLDKTRSKLQELLENKKQ